MKEAAITQEESGIAVFTQVSFIYGVALKK
jgi:hypothetical protein